MYAFIYVYIESDFLFINSDVLGKNAFPAFRFASPSASYLYILDIVRFFLSVPNRLLNLSVSSVFVRFLLA